MSKRITKFESYATHPWLKRVFGKLEQSDLEFCRSFITSQGEASRGDFEMRVNRLFIDREKPKRWKEISELLTCCNS